MSAEYYARKKRESRQIFASVRKPERPCEISADEVEFIKSRAEASVLVIRALAGIPSRGEPSHG